MSSAAQRAELIAQLRQFPQQLTEVVKDLSAEQLTTAFLAHEWTVAQNVHHLVDSHMNAYIRCKLIATEDNPPLKPYMQDAWANFPDAMQADLTGALALLAVLHERWAQFWEALPEEAFARSGMHIERGPMSLAALLPMYVEHGLGHIDQIQRTLAAQSA